MWRRMLFIALFMLSDTVVPTLAAPTAPTAMVPSGFTDAQVFQIGQPTALAWLPDGRMLITRQTGELVMRDGNTQTTIATFGSKLCTNSERGLLGIAVDPQFANGKPYLYLYYTFNKFNQTPNNCATRTTNVAVNRVSRFTFANNAVNLNSEVVLIDNILSYAGNHNGGDVHFGKDGKLYISIGDAGCDYAGSPTDCGGTNNAARDKGILLGKILRINADGSIPSDNPFTGAGTERCNVNGKASNVNVHCQETWAWGLRNPFRFAMNPNVTSTNFYINDVGQNVWEEINDNVKGADYGWNVREGHCANGSTSDCGTPPAGMTNPIFDYKHGANPAPSPFQNCNSITGGAFVPTGLWSSQYTGYLFSDYVCGKIFLLKDGTATEFASNLGGSSAVHLAFGPFNNGQALYYTTYAGGGEIRRISFNNNGNNPPVASFTANPPSGNPPLTVQFNASGSSDPDGGTLRYEWNFGDGATQITTSPTINHSYTNAGVFNATLLVRDVAGLVSDPVSKQIRVAASPPTATISSPSSNKTFFVGEVISLQGSATDPEDGTLAGSQLKWDVLLHHDQHTHPYFAQSGTASTTFPAPAPEDLLAASNSYLEIRLTATDSTGLTDVVSQNLMPKKVNITLNSQPSGLTFDVDGSTITHGQAFVSWEKYSLEVKAQEQIANGQIWRFNRWLDTSDGATRSIVTPATNTSYTAVFTSTPAFKTWLPLVRK